MHWMYITTKDTVHCRYSLSYTVYLICPPPPIKFSVSINYKTALKKP